MSKQDTILRESLAVAEANQTSLTRRLGQTWIKLHLRGILPMVKRRGKAPLDNLVAMIDEAINGA